MDTSNVTLTPPAAFKTRPDSAAPPAGAGQTAPASVAAPATGTGTKALVATPPAPATTSAPATTAAPVEPSPLSRPAETVADDTPQNENLVQDVLRKLNDLTQTSIAFSQHEETGRTVITIRDRESGEEIRTIPSEDFLAIAAHLQEVLDSSEGLKPGLLVSSQA